MNNKCPQCGLTNFSGILACARCGTGLVRSADRKVKGKLRGRLPLRAAICLAVCLAVILTFYISLLASSGGLNIEQKHTVRRAIALLRDKGFDDEAFLLEHLTAFRANDNWLNAAVAKENAYAATNFPFEIMTLYPDFFTYPADDIERAAILLHEARHLKGKDEKDAYEFVWKNRKQLGWTKEHYSNSPLWRNVRQQTRDHLPNLFVCETNHFNDCTE
jgi:hypothetical protein